MKRGPGKLTFFMILATFVLVVGWAVFLYVVQGIRDKYHAAGAPLAEESGKESYVTRISRQLRETESARESLQALVVEKGYEAVFLEKIEELGAISDTSIKISGFEERGGVLRLSVTSSGRFDQVYYFLQLLEALPLGVNMDKVKIAQTINDSGMPSWVGNFDVVLRNYYVGEK